MFAFPPRASALRSPLPSFLCAEEGWKEKWKGYSGPPKLPFKPDTAQLPERNLSLLKSPGRKSSAGYFIPRSLSGGLNPLALSCFDAV